MFKRLILFLFVVLFFVGRLEAYKYKDGYYTFENNIFLDKTFNLETALFCAEASDREYDDDFVDPNGKNHKFLTKNGFNNIYSNAYLLKNDPIINTQATVAIKHINNKRIVLIAFRGTNFGKVDGISDILTDIEATQNQNFSQYDKNIAVHNGFFKAEQAFELKMSDVQFLKLKTSLQKIINAKDSNTIFLITGHSLGGAIAILFAARLLDTYGINRENVVVYTYGSPSVGNENFRYVFEDNPNKTKTFKYFYRIRNRYDPVPLLTSKTFIYAVKLFAVPLIGIVNKTAEEKLLNIKLHFFPIGKLYLFDAKGFLHTGQDLEKYVFKISGAKKFFKNISISHHGLAGEYIPNISRYLLGKDDRYDYGYDYYCNNDYKKINYNTIWDEYSGEKLEDKFVQEMTNYFVSHAKINQIDFYRIKVGSSNYCYQRSFGKIYYNDDTPVNASSVLTVNTNMPFHWLAMEEALIFKYENLKSKTFKKHFSFLWDKKFMKVVNKASMGVMGHIKKENVISFFNILKQNYNIEIPTFFNTKYDKKDFYRYEIFSDDWTKNKDYLQNFELIRLLVYFKAANRNGWNSWIMNQNSTGYKFFLKKQLNPYYYYLYHELINFDNSIDVSLATGFKKLLFLRYVYRIVTGVSK